MVLIDMEMPKSCCECKLQIDDGIGDMVCPFTLVPTLNIGRQDKCPLKPFTPPEPQITTNIYDTEEIHHNCVVQVLRNSVTGDVSAGWWKEKEEEE